MRTAVLAVRRAQVVARLDRSILVTGTGAARYTSYQPGEDPIGLVIGVVVGVDPDLSAEAVAFTMRVVATQAGQRPR